MTFKELKELRSLEEKELQKEAGAARKHLAILSFENSQGNLKDTSQLGKLRRYAARIQTIRNSRKQEVLVA